MRKWLIVCCVVLLIAGSAAAQDDPADGASLGALTTLEAGDFRALAVTADGERLLVADAETDQVRVYNFSDPAAPALLSSLDVSGTPVLLEAGRDYGLVAVTTDQAFDTLEFIAPAFRNTRAQFRAGINFIDIGKNPRALALSPDGRWGIAVSENSYTLLGINSPSEIDEFSVDQRLIDVALSNSTAYVLREGVLEAAPMQAGEALQPEGAVALEGTPSHVAVNVDATNGVVVVGGSSLVFFDPQSLEVSFTRDLGGAPVSSIAFTQRDGRELLVIAREGDSAISLIDPNAPPENAELTASVASVSQPVRDLIAYDGLILITDGTQISIFST